MLVDKQASLLKRCKHSPTDLNAQQNLCRFVAQIIVFKAVMMLFRSSDEMEL